MYQFIERAAFQAEIIHGADCSDRTIFPAGVNLVPVWWIGGRRPSQMCPFFLGNGNPLSLTLPCGEPFLFGNAGQHFDQDIKDRGYIFSRVDGYDIMKKQIGI